MSYAGLATVQNSETPHLGGNIRGGDPFTWCPTVWDYVLHRFGITSVMDFGSGSGTTALYFHRKGIVACAVDGLEENLHTAVFPTIKHDVTTGPLLGRFDLIHCQEVVEHIDEAFLPNLLQTFATAKFVLMTHALPGQIGFHHVNLQSSEYWVEHMGKYSFSLLSEDTNRIRELAKAAGAIYMSQTGLLFANSRSN